jgi:hypothetical protein
MFVSYQKLPVIKTQPSPPNSMLCNQDGVGGGSCLIEFKYPSTMPTHFGNDYTQLYEGRDLFGKLISLAHLKV